MIAGMTGRHALLLVVIASCKSKAPPAAATAPDAAASIASAVVDASAPAPIASKPVLVQSQARPGTFEWKVNTVDVIAVSSRVDNGGETPLAVVDGSLDTAWSSKTDDLAGAWVALRIFGKTKITSVGL